MTRVFVFSLLMLCAAPLCADEPTAPLAAVELEDGDSLVFLGDSITHQCLYTQYVEDYLYTRFPGKRFRIHNAGVGGARAWDALQRFDDDVAKYQPKYVTILLGMNDGTYVPYREEIFQTYRTDMTELLDRLEAIGATAIPMTPTMFDSRAARASNRARPEESVLLYNSVLAYYGTWLREVALDRGLGFVDMWGPLNNITWEERKSDPDFTLIKDAVHPGASGQVVMATAVINDLGFPRQVSNIRIAKTPAGEWTAKATGGELSNLEETEQGLRFTWKANSLPWVVPEDAALGAKLTRLGHRLSREAVEIHGLAAGRYELVIDGEVVGTYSADALGRHIELQENALTPQHRQAAQVAAINQERNAGPVRGLRGEWSKFQQFARIRRSAEMDPSNASVQQQLKDAEARIEGMAERVAEHEAAAKALEDKIFEVNQPVERTYELRRVAAKAK